MSRRIAACAPACQAALVLAYALAFPVPLRAVGEKVRVERYEIEVTFLVNWPEAPDKTTTARADLEALAH